MKRVFCFALVPLLLGMLIAPAWAVEVSASSAVLMDADSGRILYAKNADERRLIASTTKLMTALVALESGHALDETVRIDAGWTGIEGSSVYLQPGEELTLEALLYGMLLRSGNDAAAAVAGYCAGSQDAFVQAMNRKARELDMADSHFENPSGLDGETHYSTARDMAKLARACLRDPQLAKIVKTRSVTFGTRYFTNHNKLLWRYEGCIGLKTGYTEKAGRTLVSAAQRNGMTLICVTLNAPNDWADHAALFDFGFFGYAAYEPVQAGERVCILPAADSLLPVCSVLAKDTVRIARAEGEEFERKLQLGCSILTAPIPKGAAVGRIEWYKGGVCVAGTDLVTAAPIPYSISHHQTPLQQLKRHLVQLF